MTEQGPTQPPKFSRRTFITGLVGLGAAIGLPGCAPQSPDSKPTNPATTVPNTTTTENPNSTTSTANTDPATTEAPTTTISERKFASPEQKAQVEAVEKNMSWFSELTQKQIDEYKQSVSFTPSVSGFSTVSASSSEPNYYREIAINLGTFQTRTGDGMGTFHVFGFSRDDGTKIISAQAVDIQDSELLAKIPDYNTRRSAYFMNVNPADNSYHISRNDQDSRLVDHKITGNDALIQELNGAIGTPVVFEYSVATEQNQSDFGYSQESNPLLQDAHKLLNGANGIQRVIQQFTSEELESIGLIQVGNGVPQNMLDGYATIPTMFANIPLNATFMFCNNIPSVMTP